MLGEMKIGVLALQGAVEPHMKAIAGCGYEPVAVKTAERLDQVKGLIIPGGESTTVGKLLERFGLDTLIKERVATGMPLYGTCTGMILMAAEIVGSTQHRLGMMATTVKRNAFGRQVDSFETDLDICGIEGGPFRAIFIRAPYFEALGSGVEAMAQVHGRVVMARQGNMLASAFHPELTDDLRVHRYFAVMVEESLGEGTKAQRH